ncbi:MAG: type I pantothenate kinase [Thermoanaerobaculia bacterium]|jgi:type I pantothenate kinase
MHTKTEPSFSPYLEFSRDQWAALRANTRLTLTEGDLADLRGINELISLEEVAQIHLPLSRLLNLHISATQDLHKVTSAFLGRLSGRTPYVIGIAGSVSAGKSTVSRILQALLSRWPQHPKVALVTTDGFLMPNAELERRGIMQRKGFPESYEVGKLIQFVSEVKSGRSPVAAPVYSHLTYDIVPGEMQIVDSPDILIVEGLNVLQTGGGRTAFVSDFFDFSIYVDAQEDDLVQWFLARFARLRETAFLDPRSYFHKFAEMPESEALGIARRVWDTINLVNLRENIEPTRERAQLILEKGPNHIVQQIRLRKM